MEIERSLSDNLTSSWERDKSGRPRYHSISVHEQVQTKKRYSWNVNDRLRSIYDELAGTCTDFHHDAFGGLSAARYTGGNWVYKLPDEIGNLFKTEDRNDRVYGKAGQLLKDEAYTYTYDPQGNLITKESPVEKWRYRWANGQISPNH